MFYGYFRVISGYSNNKQIFKVCDSMYKCVTCKRHICEAVVMGITTVKGFLEFI